MHLVGMSRAMITDQNTVTGGTVEAFVGYRVVATSLAGECICGRRDRQQTISSVA